ncbi:hypothetical protein ElyMa_000092900 [Elysia marginata]|uniref:Uncharacterized protein n=1 Tax=Elysia marginata TaxID=1093978 RepID=A0AAV4EKF9_9GAST|nr:hypothetical protein ElyMa_000092900 [Elysia marginata]
MKCSRRLTLQVDSAGKIFDIPCFSRKVVHSITFDDEGARQICEVLLSPGRNIAAFFKGYPRTQRNEMVNGYLKSKKQSQLNCTKVEGKFWNVQTMTTCEMNMVLFYNPPAVVVRPRTYCVGFELTSAMGKKSNWDTVEKKLPAIIKEGEL